MRAITLNLLVEEQLAQQAEARNPVKLTVAIGIGLITIAVLIGTYLAGVSSRSKGAADSLQSKYDSLMAAQAAEIGGTTSSIKAKSDDYLAVNQSRCLLAPQLAVIKDLIPDTMQISELHFLVVTETPPMPKVSDDEEGKRRPKPKPVDHLVLDITGRAICPRPEIEVDQFIQNVQSNDVFAALVTDVKLKSVARGGAEGGMPVANFVVECQYKEHK